VFNVNFSCVSTINKDNELQGINVNQRYTISIIQSHHTILNEISFHSDCLFVFFVFFYSFRSVFFFIIRTELRAGCFCFISIAVGYQLINRVRVGIPITGLFPRYFGDGHKPEQ
jgi:hypothetical protein